MLKELRLLNKILYSNFKCLQRPYKLTYCVTNRCNLKCLTCNIWGKETNELTIDEIEMFFSRSNWFSLIHLAGGEIVLRPDITNVIDIIAKTCKNLVVLHFPTNGFLTDQIAFLVSYAKEKLASEIVITISLDGDEETHNKIRGNNKSFQNSIKTFETLRKKKGITVFYGMTLSPFNIVNFRNLLTLIEKQVPQFSLDDVHVNVMQISEHYYGNKSLRPIATSDYLDVLRYIINKKRATGIAGIWELIYLHANIDFLKNKSAFKKCTALSSSCFLSANGDIYPCIGLDKKIGNVKEYNYDLTAFLKTPESLDFRKSLKCNLCWTACEAFPSMLACLPATAKYCCKVLLSNFKQRYLL